MRSAVTYKGGTADDQYGRLKIQSKSYSAWLFIARLYCSFGGVSIDILSIAFHNVYNYVNNRN